MSIQLQLQQKLESHFSPSYIQIVNESHMHRGPAGSESHFKLILVSTHFSGKRLLQRHRMVNEVLAQELANEIHALAMHTYTPEEWANREAQAPITPSCKGG